MASLTVHLVAATDPYEVDTEPVFDARNEQQRAALGVSDPDLSCPAWEAEILEGAVPSSQTLADRLIAAGYTGMLVQSFDVGAGLDDINLVLWKWGASRPSLVVLIDDERRLSRGPELT